MRFSKLTKTSRLNESISDKDVERKLIKAGLDIYPEKVNSITDGIRYGWIVKNAEYYGNGDDVKKALNKVGLGYLEFYHHRDGWFIFAPENKMNRDEITNRLNFVRRDYNELIKNVDDEAMVYLKTVNLVCNGIKLLGTLDSIMDVRNEINTDKYKKLINGLVKEYL